MIGVDSWDPNAALDGVIILKPHEICGASEQISVDYGIEPIANSLDLDHILKRHHITEICSFAMNVPLEGIVNIPRQDV